MEIGYIQTATAALYPCECTDIPPVLVRMYPASTDISAHCTSRSIIGYVWKKLASTDPQDSAALRIRRYCPYISENVNLCGDTRSFRIHCASRALRTLRIRREMRVADAYGAAVILMPADLYENRAVHPHGALPGRSPAELCRIEALQICTGSYGPSTAVRSALCGSCSAEAALGRCRLL